MIQPMAVFKRIKNGASDDSSCHLGHCLFVWIEVFVLGFVYHYLNFRLACWYS